MCCKGDIDFGEDPIETLDPVSEPDVEASRFELLAARARGEAAF
jgi:hypothetical protein